MKLKYKYMMLVCEMILLKSKFLLRHEVVET